jgi:hypothetical protein
MKVISQSQCHREGFYLIEILLENLDEIREIERKLPDIEPIRNGIYSDFSIQNAEDEERALEELRTLKRSACTNPTPKPDSERIRS